MKNKSAQKLLIVLFLFLILREFLPISLTYYKSYSTWNSSSNSSTEATSIEREPDFDESFIINFDKGEEYNINCDGLYEKESSPYMSDNAVIVSVTKNLNISPLRFLPLIKPLDFSSHNSYRWSADIYSHGKLHFVSGSGRLDVSGDYNIYGVCSGKDVKKMINKTIISNLERQIQAEIRTKLISIEK